MRRIYWFLAVCVLFAAVTVVTTGKAHAAICGGTPCVDSADIINGSVAGQDISSTVMMPGTRIVDESVTGADIKNGSLTGADLAAGTIGSAQVNNTQVQSRVAGSCATGSSISVINADGTVGCETDDTGAAAHRVVVATSGGDYTTISAALAAISPTATDPYVIDVMPGTYIENITMKSYVHLRGAGREVTAIQSPSTSTAVITLSSLTNTAISGFTITGGRYGIYNNSSSPMITGNAVTGNGWYGIQNDSSSPTITGNTFTGNTSGIFNNNSSSPTITGNTVTGNTYTGVANQNSSPTITGNTVTGNGAYGVYNYSSSPTITGNTITGNSRDGIVNGLLSSPTITGNTITGNSSTGIFNSTSSSPTITGNTITGNS
ncbi:MAG: pectinesterase family protein, partial [Deltaproteobacteria bacterium]|nr:pectinesterase family protein [Deltaproteobacteria bacterium]